MLALVIAVSLSVFPSVRPPRYWSCVADETESTRASLGVAAARRVAQKTCLELARTDRQAFAARVGLKTAPKPQSAKQPHPKGAKPRPAP